MIEALKSEEIVNKVGGRFKLTALIQKRMLELMQGSGTQFDPDLVPTFLSLDFSIYDEMVQQHRAADPKFDPSEHLTSEEKAA